MCMFLPFQCASVRSPIRPCDRSVEQRQSKIEIQTNKKGRSMSRASVSIIYPFVFFPIPPPLNTVPNFPENSLKATVSCRTVPSAHTTTHRESPTGAGRLLLTKMAKKLNTMCNDQFVIGGDQRNNLLESIEYVNQQTISDVLTAVVPSSFTFSLYFASILINAEVCKTKTNINVTLRLLSVSHQCCFLVCFHTITFFFF